MINLSVLIRAKQALPVAANQQDFFPLSCDILSNQLICFLGARFSVLNIYLQMLAGIHKPYSGDVSHFVTQCSARFPVIAYLNYNSTLLSVLSGLENVKLPALYHQLDSKEQIDLKAVALLEEMNYGADHSLLPAFMSGLQKRHLLIARAIMLEPKILFIENPFAGLELAEATILGDYLATLVKNKQMTVITSNAHLDFVEHYGQQIIYAAADHFEFFSQWQSFLVYKQQHRLKF